MARKRSPLPSAKLHLTTTQQVMDDLTRLAGTGYFGQTAPEVAEEILRTALRLQVAGGELDRLVNRKKNGGRRSK